MAFNIPGLIGGIANGIGSIFGGNTTQSNLQNALTSYDQSNVANEIDQLNFSTQLTNQETQFSQTQQTAAFHDQEVSTLSQESNASFQAESKLLSSEIQAI